jgi:sporulation-control protein spo0M
MGFFDKFGAGGGTVTVQIQVPQAAAGSMMRGTLTFTGGKRQQTITALMVWLTRGKSTNINLAKGGTDERDGGSAPIGDKHTLASQFVAEPGKEYRLPFELPIPTMIMNSRSIDVNGQAGPILQHYRVWGTADIPGEIDKHGHSDDFEVTGGAKLEVTIG